MEYPEYLKFKTWANNRVNKAAIQNRADDFSVKADVAAILARDYQQTLAFKESVKGYNIKSLVDAIADLKEEAFAYVCNVSAGV